MKIAEQIIDFILGIAKKAILVGIIGGAMIFAILVFTIFMPEQVINAFEILKSLIGS